MRGLQDLFEDEKATPAFSQCAVMQAPPGWLEGFCTNVDHQREFSFKK